MGIHVQVDLASSDFKFDLVRLVFVGNGALEDLEDKFLPEMWRNPPPEALAAGHQGSDYFIARDIVGAIREDRQPQQDVYRALDFTLPGLMSEKSITLGGTPIKIPDFRSGEWD